MRLVEIYTAISLLLRCNCIVNITFVMFKIIAPYGSTFNATPHYMRARSIFHIVCIFLFSIWYTNCPFLPGSGNLFSYVCKTVASHLADKAFCFQNPPRKRYFFFCDTMARYSQKSGLYSHELGAVTQGITPPLYLPSATVYLHYKAYYTKGEERGETLYTHTFT